MHRVFLSYASLDKADADHAVQALETAGLPVWYAPRDVRPGAPYAGEITDAICSCDLLVVLVSDNSLKSEMVLRELEVAASNRRRVLPVRVSPAMPGPEMRFYIGREHWLDLFGRPDTERASVLVEAVKGRLDSVTPRPGTGPTAPASGTATTGTGPVTADSPAARSMPTVAAHLAGEGDLAALRAQAEAGDRVSQRLLGIAYRKGRGVPKDLPVGAKWLRMAADQGDSRAQALLGAAHLGGDGVVRDYAIALVLLRKAADAKEPDGLYHLGQCYYKPWGVERDESKALALFHDAAEHGSAKAYCVLGTFCANGIVVAKDDSKAFEWYLGAANRGHPFAQLTVATWHFSGRGVARNENEGVAWYRRFATDCSDNDEDADGKYRYMIRQSFERPGYEALLRAAMRPDGGVLVHAIRTAWVALRVGMLPFAIGFGLTRRSTDGP